MQREVIKWLQSLDLTHPVRNPRRDFCNGFTAAEIVSRYADPSVLTMAAITNSSSSESRRCNWQLVLTALQKLGCRTISSFAVDNVVALNPNAALNVLENMYEFLTKRALPMRTLDASSKTEFLQAKDAKNITALLETTKEIVPDSIPTDAPHDADADDRAALNHYMLTSLHHRLATGHNIEITGGLKPLQKPQHARETVASLLHSANHKRYQGTIGQDKYVPDELMVTRRNEHIMYQHEKVNQVLREAQNLKPGGREPLTTLLRGRYANSKIYEQKSNNKNRHARRSSNLLQDVDNAIGARKLEVNTMSDTLMKALESNGIYLNRDTRAGEKSVEFFTMCGFSIRKAFSSILKDVLAAHRELVSLVERSGKNSEGDVLEDLFTAFVSHRDQLSMDTLEACWAALEQNTAGIAAAVNAREEEYSYIIQTLNFLFTLDSAQVQALHVSGAGTAQQSLHRPRQRSQSLGNAILDAYANRVADPLGTRRLAVREDRHTFHLASAFVLLSRIGEAMVERDEFVAEKTMELHFLPAALPSLLHSTKPGMVEAVSRVIVASTIGQKISDGDDDAKKAGTRLRLEKLVSFMEFVIQPLVIAGGSINTDTNTQSCFVPQRRQRYYLLLYHVMRQAAEAQFISFDLDLRSQREAEENPLVRLASETAARCLSSEHSATRSIGVATTLMLLLWDCWMPVTEVVKKLIILPALNSSDCGLLSCAAGEWEGRVLALELLSLLFKKIVLILVDEELPQPSTAPAEPQRMSHFVIKQFPFVQLDRATARYLKTFMHAPLSQRRLALTVVGQHLLPDCHPLLARTWLEELLTVPDSCFDEVLLAVRMEVHEVSKISGSSPLPSTSKSPASISLIQGQVEPTYTVLPLNQTWDTHSVMHVMLCHLHRLEAEKILAIAAAALLSPQEQDNQFSQLMRSFKFTSVPERCALEREEYGSLTESDTASLNVTLQELVLTERKDPFKANSPDPSQLRRSSSSISSMSEDMEDSMAEPESESTASTVPSVMNGERVSRSFWYAVLERLTPIIRNALSAFDPAVPYESLCREEQLAAVALWSLYQRYGTDFLSSAAHVEDVSCANLPEAISWLNHLFPQS